MLPAVSEVHEATRRWNRWNVEVRWAGHFVTLASRLLRRTVARIEFWEQLALDLLACWVVLVSLKKEDNKETEHSPACIYQQLCRRSWTVVLCLLYATVRWTQTNSNCRSWIVPCFIYHRSIRTDDASPLMWFGTKYWQLVKLAGTTVGPLATSSISPGAPSFHATELRT
jgi:hypothetical protein